jgi:hypothetical protein
MNKQTYEPKKGTFQGKVEWVLKRVWIKIAVDFEWDLKKSFKYNNC